MIGSSSLRGAGKIGPGEGPAVRLGQALGPARGAGFVVGGAAVVAREQALRLRELEPTRNQPSHTA